MIGAKREAASSSGAALSVIGGGNDPGQSIPSGVDGDYIVEFARLHEASGFDMAPVGYASSTADGFLIAAHAAAHTTKLGYVISHRPGFVSPTPAARKAATLDQLTSRRIVLHIISGGSDEEQRKDGDWLEHDARYRRTDEYMEILRRTWTEPKPFDHVGEFYSLQGAHSDVRPFQTPHIPLFFGGASEAALEVGSKRADVYALWGEPLHAIREQIAEISRRAQDHGRRLSFSLSVRPIIGETEKEAWDKAREILSNVERNVTGTIKKGESARPQSVGSRRLLDFAAQSEVHDKRLWMSVAEASGAPGSTSALVGTAEQVADSLADYYDAGCTTFIIRGFDPLNDVAEYGRELIPILRESVARRRPSRVL